MTLPEQQSVVLTESGDPLVVSQAPVQEMTAQVLETVNSQPADTVYYTYVTDQGNLSRVQSISINQ